MGLETLWANDIDPKACLVYRTRFNGALHEGDAHHFVDSVPPHNILTGGFPCQPFSSAGKKQGIRDPRGTLFQVLVQSIDTHRPEFFVLENVKRLLSMENGCHFATILAALANLGYCVEWRLLNAMNFGLAQNRQRIIVLGSRPEGRHGMSYLAPADDFDAVSDRTLDRIHDRKQWWKIEQHGEHFGAWGFAIGDRFVSVNLDRFSEAKRPVILKKVLDQEVPTQFDFTASMKPRLSQNEEVNRFVDGVEIISNQKGGARMGYTVFGVHGLAPTLTAATSRHYERYKVGHVYRRLTNVEYARLQGFPDDHCNVASVYDQYVLYGNAVPPPLVQWVLGRIKNAGSKLPSAVVSQLDFALNENNG